MVAHLKTSKSVPAEKPYMEPKSIELTQSDPTDSQLTDIPAKDLFDWRQVESLRVAVQISLTFVLLIFCLFKLSDENNDKALYWGGVMSVVAWWMPTPGASASPQSKK